MPTKILLLLALLPGFFTALAQPKTPADFGYRHLRMRYQRDTEDILVLSKKGEELTRKLVFFFAQSSTPSLVVLYDEGGPYRLFSHQDGLVAGALPFGSGS